MKCDRLYQQPIPFNPPVKRQNLQLYAITPRASLTGQALLDSVQAAIDGGITCLQLRQKNLPDDRLLYQANQLRPLCQAAGIPLLINDRVEVALRAKADGVHIGQQDGSVLQIRRRIGPNRILGVSARTVPQALAAQAQGADYLGVGALFNTSTKADARLLDFGQLIQICRVVSIPVVAIGGIEAHNIHQLTGTGIAGVAASAAVFGGADIGRQCRQLRAEVEAMLGTGMKEKWQLEKAMQKEGLNEQSINDCRLGL